MTEPTFFKNGHEVVGLEYRHQISFAKYGVMSARIDGVLVEGTLLHVDKDKPAEREKTLLRLIRKAEGK